MACAQPRNFAQVAEIDAGRQVGVDITLQTPHLPRSKAAPIRGTFVPLSAPSNPFQYRSRTRDALSCSLRITIERFLSVRQQISHKRGGVEMLV